MYIDFAITNTDINDTDVKQLIINILKYKVDSITVPYYLLRNLKASIDTNNTHLSCLIDYPLGISDLKTRRFAVEQAIKAGASSVDITMPQNLAANRKYDKIREDIRAITELCAEHTVQPRYILEYRVFDHHCLKKICEIFDTFNIRHIYPSTGYFIDNLADNILASIFLYQNSKDIDVLCTGNTWTDKHFITIAKSGLFGFRTSSLFALENFVKYDSIRKNKNGV